MEFTWTRNPNCPLPLCIVCGEKLADSAIAPAKLKRHLTTKHPELSDKNELYFKRKLTSNKMQVSMFTKKFKVIDKSTRGKLCCVGDSCKQNETHVIAESVILPACQQIVRIMFGEEAVSEQSKIPLSDNTISRRIHDMSENIQCDIKSKILKHKLFALQVIKT